MSSASDSDIPQTNDRARQAEKISQHPEDYKVCEGCGSIVTLRAVACPSCHAYLFDASHDRVVNQAQILATRLQSGVLSSDLA
jgi:hypothetical protein